MGVWEEILELTQSVTSLTERLNRTVETMNDNTNFDMHRFDTISSQISDIQAAIGVGGRAGDISELRKDLNELKSVCDGLEHQCGNLKERQLSDLKDIFELQEALVAYLDKHPTKYKEIRELVKPLISRVRKRLKKRLKILAWIDDVNLSAMDKLFDSELDWALIEVLSRFTTRSSGSYLVIDFTNSDKFSPLASHIWKLTKRE
jgi:hypothetical protein